MSEPCNEFRAASDSSASQRLQAFQAGADDCRDGETMDSSRWFTDLEARAEYERGYRCAQDN